MQVDRTYRRVGLKVETLSIYHPAPVFKCLAVQFCKHKTAIICENGKIRTPNKTKYLRKCDMVGREKAVQDGFEVS